MDLNQSGLAIQRAFTGYLGMFQSLRMMQQYIYSNKSIPGHLSLSWGGQTIVPGGIMARQHIHKKKIRKFRLYRWMVKRNIYDMCKVSWVWIKDGASSGTWNDEERGETVNFQAWRTSGVASGLGRLTLAYAHSPTAPSQNCPEPSMATSLPAK